MKTKQNIVINTTKSWYEDDGDFNRYSVVDISATIDDKEIDTYFIVQLCAGRYEPQNNCEIYSKNGDGDHGFDENEQVIFDTVDIIDLAEEAYSEYFEDNFKDLDAEFNYSINNQSLYVRVNKDSGAANIVLIDDCHNSCNGYGVKEKYCGDFDSEDDAMQYLEQFRTDDYHDFRGLNAFIKSLRD